MTTGTQNGTQKKLMRQPNESRCYTTTQKQTLALPACCPISGNPLEGSEIDITYKPGRWHLEVEALHQYIQSYKGGRGDVRSMEGMIQQIAQDCAETLEVDVVVEARLVIAPGPQKMHLVCEQIFLT